MHENYEWMLKTHHWRLEVQLAETQRDSDSEDQNSKNISWLCASCFTADLTQRFVETT